MRRRVWIGLGVVLLVFVLGGVAMIRATSVPADLFIAPGATEIETHSYGLGEQRVTYRAPDPPYGWYFTIARRLADAGWMLPVDNRRAVETRPEVYWRIQAVGPVYLKQEIWLQGEPRVAQIIVRRELIVPWQQYVPCALRWGSFSC